METIDGDLMKSHDGDQPSVRDADGRRYSKNDRGGWVPDDDKDAPPMTWKTMQQQVPNNGELHVDHKAPNANQAPSMSWAKLTWKALRGGGGKT